MLLWFWFLGFVFNAANLLGAGIRFVFVGAGFFGGFGFRFLGLYKISCFVCFWVCLLVGFVVSWLGCLHVGDLLCVCLILVCFDVVGCVCWVCICSLCTLV